MSDKYKDEEYFCGSCKKSQKPSQGEECKSCGKQTVSKYENETYADALKKWEKLYG